MQITRNRYFKKINNFFNALNQSITGDVVKTRFIILASPRSGSNLLHHLLASHDNVKIFSELFNLFAITRPELDKILINPKEYLENIYKKKYPKEKKAIGFKIFYNQATAEQMDAEFFNQYYIRDVSLEMKRKISSLQEYLEEHHVKEVAKAKISEVWSYLLENRDIRIIHLTRGNKLKQYLSLVKAWQSDEWKSVSGKNSLNIEEFNLNPDDCRRFFEKASSQEEKFNQLFNEHPKLDLVYENLTRDLEGELNRVQKFLDLPIKTLTANLRKQRSSPAASSITNYSHLKEKFRGGKWEMFFED